MRQFLLGAKFALCGLALSAASASAANLADFTDSFWATTYGNNTVTSVNGTLRGVGFTLSKTAGRASDGLTFDNALTGGTCPVGVLACEKDGVGIGDDEVSGGPDIRNDEEITMSFDHPINLQALHFLDLYIAPDHDNFEQALFSINGGAFFGVDAVETFGSTSGYRLFKLGAAGQNVSEIRFRAEIPGRNDNIGVNDYALAAVQAVPLPAAGWMLVAGLFGLGVLGRRARA